MEGRGFIKYSFGAFYDGELKGGKPEGRGVCNYLRGEDLKMGSMKAEELSRILAVLFLMENLKVKL